MTDSTKDKEFEDALNTIMNALPRPYSGQERRIHSRCVTHYDTASENLWEAVEKFEKYVGIKSDRKSSGV